MTPEERIQDDMVQMRREFAQQQRVVHASTVQRMGARVHGTCHLQP